MSALAIARPSPAIDANNRNSYDFAAAAGASRHNKRSAQQASKVESIPPRMLKTNEALDHVFCSCQSRAADSDANEER